MARVVQTTFSYFEQGLPIRAERSGSRTVETKLGLSIEGDKCNPYTTVPFLRLSLTRGQTILLRNMLDTILEDWK